VAQCTPSGRTILGWWTLLRLAGASVIGASPRAAVAGASNFLSGHSLDCVQWMIDDDAVDLDENGLIEKRSLWEFRESLDLVLNWDK
jgi:hypothetical protein